MKSFLSSSLSVLLAASIIDGVDGFSQSSRVFVSTPVSDLPKKRVGDCMMPSPVTVLRPDLSVDDAMSLLLQSGVNGAPVVDEDFRLVGMVSSADFLQMEAFEGALLPMEGSSAQIEKYVDAAQKICANKVEDVMSTHVTTVHPDLPMREAAQILSEERVQSLPVVRDDRLVGILSSSDVMRDLLRVVHYLPSASEQLSP